MGWGELFCVPVNTQEEIQKFFALISLISQWALLLLPMILTVVSYKAKYTVLLILVWLISRVLIRFNQVKTFHGAAYFLLQELLTKDGIQPLLQVNKHYWVTLFCCGHCARLVALKSFPVKYQQFQMLSGFKIIAFKVTLFVYLFTCQHLRHADIFLWLIKLESIAHEAEIRWSLLPQRHWPLKQI